MQPGHSHGVIGAVSRWMAILTLLVGASGAIRQSSLEAPPPLQAQPSSPQVKPEHAIARALNVFQVLPGGYQLSHPQHRVAFTERGVRFAPKGGGPEWAWTLSCVCASDGRAVTGVSTSDIRPTRFGPDGVAYRRGSIEEQYLARSATVEQRFVIPEALPLAGSDLIVRGQVFSQGEFRAEKAGWRWLTDEGAVWLGDVLVYDATGRRVPAEMIVTAETTRIQISGEALAQARYPVTIDPEIGADDFRISTMGPEGDPLYDAQDAHAVYNPDREEYLVIWTSDDHAAGMVDDEFEIFGQRLSALNGQLVGARFRISDMGSSGDASFDADSPVAVYNPIAKEYLVVWEGEDNVDSLVNDEIEIFGQRLDPLGQEVGSNDFQISDMGGANGNPNFSARFPEVAFSSINNQYLVVWRGDDGVDDELEIYGERLSAAGARVGTNDFRISRMGPDGDPAFQAFSPAVTYNTATDQYLVVWRADDNGAGMVNDDEEVFGRLINAATGAVVSADDIRLSDMGPDGDPLFDVIQTGVAYNRVNNEYLVIWRGDDNTGGLVNGEFEVFGQRLGADGSQIGQNDFRISDMGPDGNPNFTINLVDVIHQPVANEYLVVWEGDDASHGAINDEFEIFGQRLSGAGNEVGENDFRISTMGPVADTEHRAAGVRVTNGPSDEYLVVWAGNDVVGGTDGEYEIFGQRIAVTATLFLPAITRDYINFCDDTFEVEENDSPAETRCSLRSGKNYQGYPDDAKDYFRVTLITAGTIRITLNNHTATGTQLQLFYQTTNNRVGFDPFAPFELVYGGPAGVYFIYVAAIGGFNSTTPYTLQAVYP